MDNNITPVHNIILINAQLYSFLNIYTFLPFSFIIPSFPHDNSLQWVMIKMLPIITVCIILLHRFGQIHFVWLASLLRNQSLRLLVSFNNWSIIEKLLKTTFMSFQMYLHWFLDERFHFCIKPQNIFLKINSKLRITLWR